MRKVILLLAAMLFAGQAGAKSIDWNGTLEIDLGFNPSIIIGGSGVATVNDSSGSAHLSTLRLNGGLTGSGTIPITDPNTTGQISAIIISGTLGGKPPAPQTHTLSGISGGPPLGANTLPLGGFTRACILASNCVSNLPLDNTENSGALSLFMTMTLHFIPEPGLLLPLGSGVVGLGLIGRSRMKR